MIYLDNAATTYPKPKEVFRAMVETYCRIGVSPGRGSYDLSTEAQSMVDAVRGKLAQFFGARSADGVIFTQNATDALNLAIQGLVKPGDHVVSTRLEHNSVLRPLHHISQRNGIDFDLVGFDDRGYISPKAIEAAIRPATRLVVVSHVSNVMGTIQPIAAIGGVCRARGVPLLVDAAQSAGVIPIDMTAMEISALAFTGHKSLLGPTGIGGLVVQPTRFGGTGIDSKNLVQTPTMPHRLEAGTLNLMGIIGLSYGLDYIAEKGMDVIHQQEMDLLDHLVRGLRGMAHVELFCIDEPAAHAPLLTVQVQGMHSSDVGAILDGDFGIAVRVGLQCAPLVHETLGTYPHGAVRFSLGPFNTMADIKAVIEAMAEINRSRSD